MKTLQIILHNYVKGDYSMNEMQNIVNETMTFLGYKICYGKRTIKAMFNGELIEVSI